MQIRCLIVDDEAPARDELRYLLSAHPRIEVIGEASNASNAIQACETLRPDLVFLDIQMPGQDGFEVIRQLSAKMPDLPLFVFVTAFDNYALKAFEASAVDYILKPVSEKRLSATLERAAKLLGEETNPLRHSLETLLAKVTNNGSERQSNLSRVSVEKNGRIRLIDPKDIVYCVYEGHRILAHTHDDIMPIYGIASMDRMEEHLSGTTFFRVHRSTLVNLDAIREFSPWFNGKYSLVMRDHKASELTVSRSRVKDFKHRLGL